MLRHKELIEKMSLEDLASQILCQEIYDYDDPEKIEKKLADLKPGSLFVTDMSPEKIKMYTDMANKYSVTPVMVASDIEYGPETAIKNSGYFPHPMAWGACNDEGLIEQAGRISAQISRKAGVHWTFSPVVDINFNYNSPECNIRSVSDNPERVIKIAGAFLKGLQTDNLMAAAVKHFPGQGVDDRSTHFVTTINTLSKEEWMNSYGKVYKKMFEMGAMSVMIGHIGLPCFDDEVEENFGVLPACFSKNLLTNLLKGELGFKGCVVSDAMTMIGACSRIDSDKEVPVRYLNAGGDVILFPEPGDAKSIVDGVKSGKLPLERLQDAVDRFLSLKEQVGLLKENNPQFESSIVVEDTVSNVAAKIADKSITLVRNYKNIIPKDIKKDSKVLVLGVFEPYFQRKPTGKEFAPLIDEFEKYGAKVDYIFNAQYDEIQNILPEYDLVVAACKMSSADYHGGTLRLGWNHVMVFWRAYSLRHPNFVLVSFGDPYKLYDLPYLHEYINAYSFAPESQRAAAKVIMGKIEPQGKSPVGLKGFFERQD